MSIYLEKFILPEDESDKLFDILLADKAKTIQNTYPFRIFSYDTGRSLTEVDFAPITIFYGSNGSGKSTLCNLIAQKAELIRVAPFNTGELFDTYVNMCEYRMGYDDYGYKYHIPNGSRIITSDEVFDYLIASRVSNQDIAERKEKAIPTYEELKFGENIHFNGIEDYEKFSFQVLSRRKSYSRRKFLNEVVGKEVILGSNGETALRFFEKKLSEDTLYVLDEPENSLSPAFQLKLKDYLQDLAKYCGCQFIIATHSPFILSIEGAKIYNLDEKPVTINKWWELDNTKTYFNFFNKYRKLFE